MKINSTDDLRKGIEAILEKRAYHEREMDRIDKIFADALSHVSKETPVITDSPTPSVSSISRRLPRRTSGGLREAIAAILVAGPATTGQIRDKLKDNGYPSEAANLQAIVNNTMKRCPREFVKTDLGAWSLVDQSAVDLD